MLQGFSILCLLLPLTHGRTSPALSLCLRVPWYTVNSSGSCSSVQAVCSKRLCALAVVQIMQERMLHFLAGSCFPVFNLIQVLPADMQFLCQPALGITAGVPFCFQCFDKFHVVHVHSSNQKRHTPCILCFRYAVFNLSGRNVRVWSTVSPYNFVHRFISGLLYMFWLLFFVIVPPLLDNGGLESSLRSHNRQSEPDTRQQAGVAICLTTATVSGSLRRLLFASLKIRF